MDNRCSPNTDCEHPVDLGSNYDISAMLTNQENSHGCNNVPAHLNMVRSLENRILHC